MSGPSKFWDRLAKYYAKRPIGDEEAYQHKLEFTRNLLHPDMQVLELGCGTGRTAIFHAPHVMHIHVVDFSANMLTISKDNAETAQVGNISFEQAGIDDVEVPDRSYDMVLGLSILHLMDNPENTIERIYDILKPDGYFISSTTCVGEKMKNFRFVFPLVQMVGLMPLVRFFTVDDLLDSLIYTGFEIEYRWQPAKDRAVFIVAKKTSSLE
ncbi:MAG: class I SAM-dependent methyltransferase [Paracoccaceae bacterium]